MSYYKPHLDEPISISEPMNEIEFAITHKELMTWLAGVGSTIFAALMACIVWLLKTVAREHIATLKSLTVEVSKMSHAIDLLTRRVEMTERWQERYETNHTKE